MNGSINVIRCQYIFNSLNIENGLPSNEVKGILKDNDGFVWIGTTNGLCRFDGSEILTLRHDASNPNSICDNDIKTIIQDHENRLWVGTGRGISSFMPGEAKYTHYSHNPQDSASLSKDKIKYLFEDRLGNIIAGPDAFGIDIFDRKTGKFSSYLPSSQIKAEPSRFINTLICYQVDPVEPNIIWFGSQLGVLKFDINEKSWRHIPLYKENANNPSLFTSKENAIRDLLVDNNGKLWLGTWGGGLCHLDPVTGKFEIIKYEPTEPINGFRNNINKLRWKSQNEIWVLAEHKGVAVFNIMTGKFRFLTDPVSGDVLNFNPSNILTDENGFIWIASYSLGLYSSCLDAHQFNKISIPHDLRSIALNSEHEDIVYLTTLSPYGNFIKLNMQTENFNEFSYNPVFDLAENYFPKIINGTETTWLLESYDLYRWDEKTQKIKFYSDFKPREFRSPPNSDFPFFISGCESATGELWLGTKFNGIFRLDTRNKVFKNYYYPDEIAGNIYFQNFIFSLFPDSKGRIWYGMTEFGYFDPVLEKFVNLSFAEDFPDAPVKSEVIRVIAETPDGYIWLGTENNGIIVIKPDKPYAFISAYTENNGLAGNLVKDIIPDNNGEVWVLTDKGLNQITPSSGTVVVYDEKYGLTNLFRSTKSNDNEIFISALGGIYHFYPDSIEKFNQSITPYLKTFKIFDKEVDLGISMNSGQKIHLKHQENFFSIEYGAINFFNPNETEFSYTLEGMDEQWISAGNRKYVSYTNLPGGNYTFRLRASDGNDHYSEISLALHIKTPFWKAIWFYIVLIILTLALLIGLYKYRLKQIRKQEEIKSGYDKMINQLEMKALRAQMNPHFLFNSLNSIRYYILKEEFENASDYITKFSKLLRLILRNSRQNMITLQEELETLGIYIEFEQMRFNKNFSFKKDLSEGLNPDDILIQPMTLQPFIENAIWHGLMPKEGDRKLSLSISRTDDLLNIIIEDNGVGRKKAALIRNENNMSETKSYGLQITKERFAILRNIRGKKSDFKITDLFDNEGVPSGTRVTIYYEI